MTPWVLAVAIFLAALIFLVFANCFPKVRRILLTIGFYLIVTGVVAVYSNWIPQIRGEVPLIRPKLNPKSIYSMTTKELADLGKIIIFGENTGYAGGGVWKGLCPLCHPFRPGVTDNRGPNLSGIVKRAAERIKEPRYLHPNSEQKESYSGSGRATTADEYIAESLACPSCYVVQGYGVKGSKDRKSPMPPIHKFPTTLTIEEMVAVHTWLYVHDGETPPPPQKIRAAYEKFILPADRAKAGEFYLGWTTPMPGFDVQ